MSLVIIIPVYKTQLTRLEVASLRQLVRVIGGKYPVRFVAPVGLNEKYYHELVNGNLDYRFEFFDRKYFKDLSTYSQLFIHPKLYQKFEAWDYLLIYQLDAFIFRDDLEDWCNQGYDYIGAPFFSYYTTLFEKAKYIGVGNGGFSLRKVETMLRIITSHNRLYDRQDIEALKDGKNIQGRLFYEMIYRLGKLGIANTTHYALTHFKGYEDFFYGYFAGPKLPWVKFPDYQTALKFSFEYNCKKLYEDNGRQLPTGCHAWWKTDREFWKPYFSQLGIEL